MIVMTTPSAEGTRVPYYHDFVIGQAIRGGWFGADEKPLGEPREMALAGLQKRVVMACVNAVLRVYHNYEKIKNMPRVSASGAAVIAES